MSEKKSFKAPNTIVLLILFLVFFTSLTWIIPGGSFDRVEKESKTVVVPGSYHEVESNPAGLDDLILAPIKGFLDDSAIEIILFILIVAGTFSLIEETETIRKIIQQSAHFFQNNPKYRPFFIPFFMTFFSIMGATFGMAEESIIFVPLFVSLSLALGYDRIVGAAIPFVGSGLGFAGAVYNPFTIAIAQGLADITIFSGFEYRMLLWLVLTSVGIYLVKRYADSIYEKNKNELSQADSNFDFSKVKLTWQQTSIFILFMSSMVILIIGVTQWNWYILELSGLFLVLGLISALIAQLNADKAVQSFQKGMNDVLGAILVIALSKSILIVLSNANAIDTILYYLSNAIGQLNPILSANLMFLVQALINIFIPSGSGQAALTIPLMAPLGDLIGITRQTVVLIFQLGDGINNLIIPTSGVMMGVLGMANIQWDVWAKWMFSKLIVLYLVGILFITLAVLIGYE